MKKLVKIRNLIYKMGLYEKNVENSPKKEKKWGF